MKIVGVYRCLHCNTEVEVERIVKGAQIFRRKENPSITNVESNCVHMGECLDVSNVFVYTENTGRTRFVQIMGHKCVDSEDARGIMHLVRVFNSHEK